MGNYVDTKQLMSEAKFFEAYSRWDDELGRYETWFESVDRVMNMHREKYAKKIEKSNELNSLIEEATESYKNKEILGAQRALQFGGEQLLKNNMRLYNCTSSYADRPQFFGEIFWILLSGAGAGFSVQFHHINKLPKVKNRTKQAKIHVVEDSIEGWAQALDVLMSSYFVGGGKHPEFEGRRVFFDLTQIRPQGAKISGGFKAPGPEPLRKALDKIEYLIQGLIINGSEVQLRPIHVYDIVMHAADAVLAGGVRRSATICLFSKEDEEMMNAKTGNWYEEDQNPQRGRSNNSVVLLREETSLEEFNNIMSKVQQYGEPGFYFVTSKEHLTNPCVEIGMFPKYFERKNQSIDSAKSGWQGCNLTEINGSKCTTKERFFKACKAAAIMGTLQAGYTDFQFVDEVTKKIFEREALLGVSITGWMNSPKVLFDEETLREGAEIVKLTNKLVADLIGIRPAARTTCTKPSGNASVLLQTASGIHAEHSPIYLRYVQMNKDQEVANLIKDINPYMVEESGWSTNKVDYTIAFPVVAQRGSLYKGDMKGETFLEKVRLVQRAWVEPGTDEELCVDPTVRHNVSNTVTVPNDGWEDVSEYLYENRHSFSGVSFIPDTGDRDYFQAPNTEVKSAAHITKEYGDAALFASGLIVDSMVGFNNLWEACSYAQYSDDQTDTRDQETLDACQDWIRRFKKFGENFFEGDLKKAEYCLKDVYILHKFNKIQQSYVPIDFVEQLKEKKFTDINTMGSAACVGTKDGEGCLI